MHPKHAPDHLGIDAYQVVYSLRLSEVTGKHFVRIARNCRSQLPRSPVGERRLLDSSAKESRRPPTGVYLTCRLPAHGGQEVSVPHKGERRGAAVFYGEAESIVLGSPASAGQCPRGASGRTAQGKAPVKRDIRLTAGADSFILPGRRARPGARREDRVAWAEAA